MAANQQPDPTPPLQSGLDRTAKHPSRGGEGKAVQLTVKLSYTVSGFSKHSNFLVLTQFI